MDETTVQVLKEKGMSPDTDLEEFWKHSTSLQAGLRVPAHVILEALLQLT